MSMKNLYHLQTKGLKDYYIIASNPHEAEQTLMTAFEKAEYGFSDYRKVEIIKNLASEIKEFPKGKPFFSDGHNLIIANQNNNPNDTKRNSG